MSSSSPEEALYRQFLTIFVLLDDGDRRTFKQIDLTTTQYNFLRALDSATTDNLTVSELADKLLCTRGNVTRLVQRLGKNGLVRTRSDERDQRLVRISLTPEGITMLAQARQLHETSLKRRLAALTLTQLQQLLDLTAEVVQLLEADLAVETI